MIMGQVLQAGVGQIPARQAAVAGGIAMDVPAVTINKVCLSGLDAIALADQLIRAGEFDVVVAGGMESMTRAPHLLPGSRAGFKYGDTTLVDHLSHDGLHDVFTDVPMGQLTETTNDLDPISRLEQDTFAARSHQLAAAATAAGIFKAEIEPVVVAGPSRRRRRRHRRGHPGRTPPSSRWASCGPPSARTAPSPPAPRRRSPTAQQLSW